jgi:hypothetical protein
MRLDWILLGLLGLMAPASTLAMEGACANADVTAAGWTQADAEQICLAVQDALDWLRTTGLRYSERLVVRPLDEKSALANGHPLGRYDAKTNAIQVLPYDAALRASLDGPSAFGATMTRTLWRSYVAHETTHAVLERHFASRAPRLAATEYIAAVVQLTVLPGATRDQILANYPDAPGWASATEITAEFYFVDPSRFAVKCYRHFVALAPTDQRAFIGRLLREGLSD